VRDLRPLAATVGVAVDVEIFRPAIKILRDDTRGGVVEHRWDVDVVEQVFGAVWVRRADAADQSLEVGVVLVATGFLFDTGSRGADAVEHFIERALPIEPLPVQQITIDLLDKAGDAEERAVLFDPPGIGVAGGDTGSGV